MNSKSIFWGLFLIVIGILFGLKNFDLVHFHWSNVFRLWPFILVFWGVTLLPLKQNYKIALTLTTVIAFFAALILLPPKSHWTKNVHINSQHRSIDRNDDDDTKYSDDEDIFYIVQQLNEEIKEGEIKIDFGAGDFSIEEASNDLFEFRANQVNGKYLANTEIENDKAFVKIKQKNIHIKNGSDFDVDANLKINSNVIWDLDLDAGAANIKMDLKEFKIRKLDIDAGATDIFIELGQLIDTVDIELDAGVSNIEIIIPKEMAGQIKSSMVLASKDFVGFAKVKKGRYQTPDFDTNDKKVFIDIDAAAAAITVKRIEE